MLISRLCFSMTESQNSDQSATAAAWVVSRVCRLTRSHPFLFCWSAASGHFLFQRRPNLKMDVCDFKCEICGNHLCCEIITHHGVRHEVLIPGNSSFHIKKWPVSCRTLLGTSDYLTFCCCPMASNQSSHKDL